MDEWKPLWNQHNDTNLNSPLEVKWDKAGRRVIRKSTLKSSDCHFWINSLKEGVILWDFLYLFWNSPGKAGETNAGPLRVGRGLLEDSKQRHKLRMIKNMIAVQKPSQLWFQCACSSQTGMGGRTEPQRSQMRKSSTAKTWTTKHRMVIMTLDVPEHIASTHE